MFAAVAVVFGGGFITVVAVVNSDAVFVVQFVIFCCC